MSTKQPMSGISQPILNCQFKFRYSPEFPIKAWIDVKVDGLLDQRKLEPMIAGIVADEAESQMMSAMESMQNVFSIQGDSASRGPGVGDKDLRCSTILLGQ